MKKNLFSLIALFMMSLSVSNAQVEQVNLEQVKGAFTTESLVLASGQVQFNISNLDVDHEVGFVLVPEGKYDAEHHIKSAYVSSPVAKGKASLTSIVNLEPGSYEYFCPLNPTAKYKLTVAADVKKIRLGQVPGAFSVKEMTIDRGTYQFEISNDGVDHEVGFVLVPQGMYDASNHIKAAYVNKPVAKGMNAKTGIVQLEPGQYEYFCPLNPTAKNRLTVK